VIVALGRPDMAAEEAGQKQTLLGGAQAVALDREFLAAYDHWAGGPDNPPRESTVPGTLLVKFAEGVDERQVARTVAAADGVTSRRPPHADFTLVELAEGADPVVAAARAAQEPGVVYAEPLRRRYALYTPNDPLLQYQWNLQRLGMERAWDINPGGSDAVVVAVIDSGVAYRSEGALAQAPDLAGTRFVAGYDFIWDDDSPLDLDGHGTHVTGTLAQSTNNAIGTAGIAFNVSVMPIKAISSAWDLVLGAPNLGTSATVAQGIRFAVDHGAKVINLSLGGPDTSTAERDAVVYAVEHGVLVVAAAGNDGEAGSPPSYPGQYAKDLDGVIAVSAVGYDLTRAPYSNVNDYVELAAPGGNLRVDLNDDGYGDGVLQQTLDPEAVERFRFNEFGYFFFHGTSMASPHVAALGALLIDQGITDPKAVEAALKAFAAEAGAAGRDDEYGYGIIEPRATLRGLGLAR
jgi:serine protease